jgi:hypothetical protein
LYAIDKNVSSLLRGIFQKRCVAYFFENDIAQSTLEDTNFVQKNFNPMFSKREIASTTPPLQTKLQASHGTILIAPVVSSKRSIFTVLFLGALLTLLQALMMVLEAASS